MKNILVLIILLLASEPTWAQAEQSKAKQVKTKKSKSSKSKNLLQKDYYDVSVQYLVWNELIEASGPGITGDGRFQFAGYQFGLTHNKPFSGIRWVRQYATSLTIGTAKGAGISGTFSDEFKNQLWASLSASAGLTYRTTAVSELSLFAPVSARFINWELASNAAIELDKEISFSAGLGFQFTQRFSTRSALMVSVAHQFLWEATQWSIGYQYSLR
jgi:hypothetical protein